MKRKHTFALLTSIFIAIAGIVACSTVPISGRNRLDLVSNDQVLASSYQAYGQFIAKAPKSRNKVQTKRVYEIGRRIALATDRYMRMNGMAREADKYRWEFNLIAERKVNAFCMPGGKIVVYEGILPLADNDHQLATVIAHEVAHAVAKHSNERMSQQVMKQMGAEILSRGLSGKNSAVLTNTTLLLYGLGTEVFYILPYSRKHEHEADLIGLYLMALAGYDYTQAEHFWQNMAQLGKSGNDFLSTHPSDDKRIQAIRNEIPKVQAFMQQNATTINNAVQQKSIKQTGRERKVPLRTRY